MESFSFPKPPETASAVELPGLSTFGMSTLDRDKDLWRRVTERAIKDHITDERAFNIITDEDNADESNNRRITGAP